MPIWTLAAKDLRLLFRDPRAAVILLVMPLMFIIVLGLSLGESFGEKPDERLRISIVNLDRGLPDNPGPFPGRPWSQVVLQDLAETADIRVETIATVAEAEALIARNQRSAVLVFKEDFSEQVHRCSFLSKADPPPLNPFYRDGISLEELHIEMLKNSQQPIGASIIEQVAQVTMLRVVMPWMIGKAFDRVGDPQFMDALAGELPVVIRFGFQRLDKKEVGDAVKRAISKLFDRYSLTAKTWPELTKQEPRPVSTKIPLSPYASKDGSGLLKRGAVRYQILVPSYSVMFAFFLVLACGWLFVAERRQGTLVRLRAAPLARWQIILGKLLPCLFVALFQGFFLMIAGKLLFGMSWGTEPLWVAAVVICTAFAAMGLALLVAAMAKTETQVAIYGTLIVLVLAGVSGAMMPPEYMPEEMQLIRMMTPHAWALDAYSQLLNNPAPELAIVSQACGVLFLFGLGFLVVAYWLIQLD